MNVLVETTEYQEAWRRLELCHGSTRDGGRPRHLRLLGQSGTGKTFIIRQYAETHPRKRLTDRVTVPVLIVAIPASPTLKALYQCVLRELGASRTGSVEELLHQAVKLIRNLAVELLVLDEMNHVLDRGRLRTRESLTDSIKAFVDAIGIPTVFAGAVRIKELFSANSQLRSRSTSSFTLRPFNLEQRLPEMRGFIKAFLDGRVSKAQANWMSSVEMATRHFYATDGIQRQLVEFLEVVPRWPPEDAFDNERFMAVLADLFQRYLWEDAPALLNPYNPGFAMRRLCKRGEPYEPTGLDGENHDAPVP